MDIAIFGAGVAGLCSAVALGAIGHRCRVYEKHSANLEAGMAFILAPEALDSLKTLGVELNAGVALRCYQHHDQFGKLVSVTPLPKGVRCVRRNQLLQTLHALLAPQSIVMEKGGFSHFDFGGERFDRAQLINMAPEPSPDVTADLFIAADGLRSRARQALFPDSPGKLAEVFEIVGLSDDAEISKWAGSDCNKFHALGGGMVFGILPTESETLVWYMQFNARLLPSSGLRSKRELKEFVHAWLDGWAPPVSRTITRADFSTAHLWRPIDLDVPPSFHRANLVLIGDAAHPLLPFSSQGVSSAIRDAIALAGALQEFEALDEALNRYSIIRREACKHYVAQGRELTAQFFKPIGGGADVVPMAIDPSKH